jgi:deoxycytidylate deaminase
VSGAGSQSQRHQDAVIALTGSFASGCTTVAEHISGYHGFFRYRLSRPISEEAKKRGLPREDRAAMQRIGDELREKNGDAYLAHLAAQAIEESGTQRAVVDGVRHIEEIRELHRRFPRVFLVAVAAPRDERWLRAKTVFDLDERAFNEVDARDADEGLPHGQQVTQCVSVADAVIQNADHLDLKSPRQVVDLFSRVDDLVNLMLVPGSRGPSPEELNMSLAANAALRSSCLRRQVGAVICSPAGTVVSVGYNEVPPTERPCVEEHGRCYRERIRTEQATDCPKCGEQLGTYYCPTCGAELRPAQAIGRALDLCRSLHAEENAILNLARSAGPSPVGGVLFTTTFPCMLCAKKIAALPLERVVYIDPYPVKEAWTLLERCGIKADPFNGVRARAFQRLFTAS